MCSTMVTTLDIHVYGVVSADIVSLTTIHMEVT